MIWAYEILLSLWFGYLVVTFLVRNEINAFHRFFAGIPIGLFTFAWISFIVSAFIPLNEYCALLVFIILTTLSLILTNVNKKYKIKFIVHFHPLHFCTYIISGLFLVLIMYFAMLRNDKEVKGAAYGDMPFHMNIISSFSHGINNKRHSLYDVKSLFYINTSLAYPFITNFHTASLMATGRATLRMALFLPTALFSLTLITSMYSLFYTFSRDHLACFFSIILFFNLGGLCWINLFDTNRGHMDFEHDWGKNQQEYWFHPIFHILVPQRASLFSMPLCYWSLYFIILGIKTLNLRFMILAGLYVGFMPLVQIHSYVGIAQWAIIYAAITFPWKSKEKWMNYIILWAAFAVSANIMAFPQLKPYMGRLESNKKEFVQFNPIWSANINKQGLLTPIICWWRGLGVFAAISLFFGFFSLNVSQIINYVPSYIVFILTNLIRYQPWEMDNTKVFYAAWIPLALPVAGIFFSHIFKNRGTVPIASVLLFASCFSALIHSIDCLSSYVTIYSNEDHYFGKWLSENIPVNALTVSADHHNHPISNLAGRMMFHGYGGWVASHGLEWYYHDQERKELCNDPDNYDFEKYNITYVIQVNNDNFRGFGNITNNGRWAQIFFMRGNAVYKYIPSHFVC